MRVSLFWRTWGLPFGFSHGKSVDRVTWAFSIGPVHIYSAKKEKS